MNLRKLVRTIRAYRAGEPLGDVAVLKLDALSTPPSETVQKLARVREYAPKQDLALLRTLTPGSLGREYARFLDANGIEPLEVSAAVKEQFRENPYALRYTATHDLHHVLTGFDTGLAGEAGVAAFNVAQGSAPVGRALLLGVRVIWSLLSPTQARRIWHNVSVGFALGRRATLVIAEPIEAWFEEPLAAVRARLAIADPRTAGVLPSGASLLGDWLYRKKKLA